MRPRKRFQKANDGTEGPTSLLFFDTESQCPPEGEAAPVRTYRLRFWCAAYVRREGAAWREPVYHQGEDSASFWSMVDSYCQWKKPLWLFAHNIGFDLTELDFWDELEKYRYTAGPIFHPTDDPDEKPKVKWRGRLFVEGRPTFLVVKGNRGLVKMVDTGNYWPSSLAAIGDRAGLPKLPMPAWSAPAADWFQYCRRDVDVCRVAVCDLIDRWLKEDCGVFQMTAPALAMHNYQHTNQCTDAQGNTVRVLLEDDSPARPLERASYLGGRVEPFFLGRYGRPTVHLDCNSLYGHVMARELFPFKRVRQLFRPTVHDLERFAAAYGVIAAVTINTKASSETYPLKRHGVQLHACGRFPTALAGPELLRALRNGHVESVAEAHLYSLAALFRGWVDKWMQRKEECRAAGDDGGAEFAKLIYTSLPGKYGQRGDWWVDHPARRRSGAWGLSFVVDLRFKSTSIFRYVAGHCQKKTPGEEPASAFPAISAYVTSYAREHMRRAFSVLPYRSLLYTATDSIICTLPGLRALEASGLVHPTRPGDFRVKDRHGDVEILGPNWYRADAKWVCAGLWGKAKLQANGTWTCEVWDQLGSLVQSNPKGAVHVRTVTLDRIQPTKKGNVDEKGWMTPYRFSGDEDFTDRSPRPQYPHRPEQPAL